MTDPATDERISTADLAGTTARESEAAPDEARRGADVDADRRTTDERPASAADAEQLTPLFPTDRGDAYRDRWRTVQTNFVDDPRQAVEEADGLVAQVIKELAQSFADERGGLEGRWGRGDDVSTEDLRVALRRYRSFFDRLLSV